jgi:hypothetical protein
MLAAVGGGGGGGGGGWRQHEPQAPGVGSHACRGWSVWRLRCLRTRRAAWAREISDLANQAVARLGRTAAPMYAGSCRQHNRQTWSRGPFCGGRSSASQRALPRPPPLTSRPYAKQGTGSGPWGDGCMCLRCCGSDRGMEGPERDGRRHPCHPPWPPPPPPAGHVEGVLLLGAPLAAAVVSSGARARARARPLHSPPLRRPLRRPPPPLCPHAFSRGVAAVVSWVACDGVMVCRPSSAANAPSRVRAPPCLAG